jgi:hypothetical protein
MLNWVRRNSAVIGLAAGVLLAILNWTLTFAPVGNLPARYAPAIFTTLSVGVIVWLVIVLQSRSPSFTPAHLNEIKELALQVGARSMTDTPFMANEVRERHTLTAHFPKIAALLRKSKKLLAEDGAARKAVRRRASKVEKRLGLKGGGAFADTIFQACWVRATGGGLNAPFVVDWKPQDGAIKVRWPKEQQELIEMATYGTEAERDLLLQRLNAAVDETRRWKETKRWNRVYAKLRMARLELSESLTAVVYMQFSETIATTADRDSLMLPIDRAEIIRTGVASVELRGGSNKVLCHAPM